MPLSRCAFEQLFCLQELCSQPCTALLLNPLNPLLVCPLLPIMSCLLLLMRLVNLPPIAGRHLMFRVSTMYQTLNYFFHFGGITYVPHHRGEG